MSTVRVFINGTGVEVPREAQIADAVASFDADLGAMAVRGTATITDGRGIACDPADPVHAGAIFRVYVSARSGQAPPDDIA